MLSICHREAEEAKAEFEQDPIAPLEIEITPNEPTNPVGKISAVLEGSHIIVQVSWDRFSSWTIDFKDRMSKWLID